MRLVKVEQCELEKAAASRVRWPHPVSGFFLGYCRACGTSVHSVDGYADLDGPAFKSYMCPGCAEKVGWAHVQI